jgi:hypothetical protein
MNKLISFNEYSRLSPRATDWEGRGKISRKARKDLGKRIKNKLRKVSGKGPIEDLDPNADAGDYVTDFRKSDAPQFKGKSDKKIQKMAIAAYLANKEKK